MTAARQQPGAAREDPVVTDRAGFTRRWGVHVFRDPANTPWASLGLHLDWHTPSLDLFLVKFVVQIGRNQHDSEGRFSYAANPPADGHTDQCLCWNRMR